MVHNVSLLVRTRMGRVQRTTHLNGWVLAVFIPYQTDAPIYHWPFATVGLILVNTLVFAAVLGATQEQIDPWTLQWGDGLHPIQWVTSNFLHAGFMHLLGNMFCLWGFGLVVEGKIGWWRFLLVYLAIGVVECAVEQTLTLGMSEGSSLGASAAIFGILAMALVWAPKNEMSCIMLIFYRPFHFDCSILALSGLAVFIEVATWTVTMIFRGDSMTFVITSQVLHLMGAAAGFGVAIVMLKKGWVDCENWDLFSVMAGRNTMSDEDLAEMRRQSDDWQQRQHDRRESALEQICEIIADGRPELAYKAHQKMARSIENWHLPEPEFLKLIAAYHDQKLWSESVEPMVEYLRQYREHEPQVRLRLAHVLTEIEKRPGQALKVMDKISPDLLSEGKRELLGRLRTKAERLRDEDPYEPVDEDW